MELSEVSGAIFLFLEAEIEEEGSLGVGKIEFTLAGYQ